MKGLMISKESSCYTLNHTRFARSDAPVIRNIELVNVLNLIEERTVLNNIIIDHNTKVEERIYD